MDELSGFKFAPSTIGSLEDELLARADVVFAGGRSLYLAKRGRNANTFLFPSSVDADHFRQARQHLPEPADQAGIAHPRIGYFGVIDERIDLRLIAHLARSRPDWNIVMVGPVAKIKEGQLPRAANLHWLGIKPYDALPAYLSGWDVAIMPFALNEATRHISPTKTPEYLCGGKPVVSTPIEDVVRTYGGRLLVSIAAYPRGFELAVSEALSTDRGDLLRRADNFLGNQSWDVTWVDMERLVTAYATPHTEDPATTSSSPALTDLRADYPDTPPTGVGSGALSIPAVASARSR
jgi:UDP-galactopyranose mutase